LEDLLQQIRDAGLRITQPRIAILRALLRQEIPISIDRLHREVQKTGCDLVTVYRCLDAFEQIGLVRHCYFLNGTALYELARADLPGYYVIDRDAGAVRALDADLARRLQDTVHEIERSLQARGYRGVRTLVEFVGERDQMSDQAAAPRSSVLTHLSSD
jgi:Fur family ferric uptake transcriptional regulator